MRSKGHTDCAIIADDSGLMVDYLNGEPGVYSARYAGDNTTPEQGMDKLLKNLDGVPFEGRSAHFVTVIALIMPDGTEYSFEGRCDGYITNIKKGENGFGFDPIFLLSASRQDICRAYGRRKEFRQPPQSRHSKTCAVFG